MTSNDIPPTTITRRRLPDRRASETFQVEHAGLKCTVTFSRFHSGELAECFVQNHKRGGGADTAVRDAGILLSFALQYGCQAEIISRALSRNSDGSASGVMAAVLDQIMEND